MELQWGRLHPCPKCLIRVKVTNNDSVLHTVLSMRSKYFHSLVPKDKHSSLLGQGVGDEGKKAYNFDTRDRFDKTLRSCNDFTNTAKYNKTFYCHNLRTFVIN
jgi:hypothetical protein